MFSVRSMWGYAEFFQIHGSPEMGCYVFVVCPRQEKHRSQ
jgi:hypothetical protein